MTTRRGFLRGVASFLAAPAIVRVASIMPVKALPADLTWFAGGAVRVPTADITNDKFTIEMLLEAKRVLLENNWIGINNYTHYTPSFRLSNPLDPEAAPGTREG